MKQYFIEVVKGGDILWSGYVEATSEKAARDAVQIFIAESK